MNRSFQKRALRWFAIALAGPAVLAILSFYVTFRHRSDVAWVVHTKDALVQIDRVLDAITTAESDQRGFLLTSQQPYLDQFKLNESETRRELSVLRALTFDNPVQRNNIRQLTTVVETRFRLLYRALESFRSASRVSDETVSYMNRGTEVMRRVRAASRTMIAEENRLLSLRVSAEQKSERDMAICFGTGFALNVCLLYWAYSSTRQYGFARDLAEFEIRQANAKLEQRVQERTAELEAANEQLRRSNEDLTRFAYVASHDLQEPLRTVGSYAGLLGRRYEGKLDEQADKYIRFVVDGAKRMQILVQDLLEYSRAGTQALNISRVDLEVVLQQVKDNLRLAIAERKAQIISGPLPSIEADGSKLTLVLQNLIGNSMKFSGPGQTPEILVSARREKDVWAISVQDNGIGFESEYAEKIFVIFQRLHQVGAYPGTGIGLAICKRIVEGHGGQISAASTPGAGSTFTFSIPIHRRNFVRSASAGSNATQWAGGDPVREQSGQNIAG